MRNRFLSALPALCMVLTLLPAAAFAEGEGGGAGGIAGVTEGEEAGNPGNVMIPDVQVEGVVEDYERTKAPGTIENGTITIRPLKEYHYASQ